MTNREKYIDNASNEALAEKIIELGQKDILRLSGISRRANIMKWLSQEAKEDDKEWLEEIERKNEEYTECEDPDEVEKGLDETFRKIKEKNIEKSKKVNFIKNEENEKLKWKEIKSLRDKIDIINDRLYRLEKMQKCQTEDEDYYEREELYQLDEGEFKFIPKSADEMFEELGYKIDDEQEDGSIQYTKEGNIEKDDFEISIIDIQKKNDEWVFYKMQDYDLEGITEAEDKAIHKKISELK